MILVSGGTYLEKCNDPYWHELYGSGLRAAVALSKLTAVEFHTYVSDIDVSSLEIAATTFGITHAANSRASQISFTYQHPLAVPRISPPAGAIARERAIEVNGQVVLRFGMLEGDAVVNSKFAVYDPQDPVNPEPFGTNGSKAEHLAIVANYFEASHLARTRDIGEISRKLLGLDGAEVVVVKRGALGCLVITQEAITRIPAFPTSKVWPIGSGDIFAAAFAYYWGEKQLPPLQAARFASMSSALYCESRTLPLPENIETRFGPNQVEVDPARYETALVYLAGPFFNMAERWLVDQARNALRDQRLNVFSPFHDVGVGVATDVVPADIDALERCTVVLALLDHFDPGTVFEIGWARKRKIPVIVFVENEREEPLKMFEGTECEILHDFSSAIYRTVWAALAK